jgi:hypothetical protein
VEVRVAPAQGLLEELVEQAEWEVARHPYPAPHRRFAGDERDLELIDRDSLMRLRLPSSWLFR